MSVPKIEIKVTDLSHLIGNQSQVKFIPKDVEKEHIFSFNYDHCRYIICVKFANFMRDNYRFKIYYNIGKPEIYLDKREVEKFAKEIICFARGFEGGFIANQATI